MSLRLKPEEYEAFDAFLNLGDEEFYAVVTTKMRGKWVRSLHVFARKPLPKELTEYERTAQSLRFRGNRTDVEGSQITAARQLYDLLIARAYNVPVNNRTIMGPLKIENGRYVGNGLDRAGARQHVDPMMKRAALRDALGEHYSEAQIAEREGDDESIEQEEDRSTDRAEADRAPAGDPGDPLPRA